MAEDDSSTMLYLLSADDCNDHGDTELICAARRGDVAQCSTLLEAGADVNSFNENNSQTALLAAIESHHVQVVDVLLDYGADVQMVDNVGISPLYSAIRIKDAVLRGEMVGRLVSAGCDVNVGSQDHVPLFLAARLGALSVVKMLCAAHCDVNVANKYGVTPTYEAVLNGHNSVLEFLLSQGGCPNKQDVYGVSALHVAAMFDKQEAVRLLLRAGACVKLRNHDGRCAVHVAVEQGKSHIVEIFLKHGVDITCPPTSITNLPCLRTAAQNGYGNTIRVLIRGCSRLPVEEIMEVFRDNRELLELYLHCGVDRRDLSTLTSYLASFQEPRHTAIKSFQQSVPSLKQLGRASIRHSLGNKILYSVNFLPLPGGLQSYISLESVNK